MNRILSPAFEADLSSGALANLLQYVHSDFTLDLEIRSNYINIYYSGGNILKVSKANGRYEFEFNQQYFNSKKLHTAVALKSFMQQRDWYSYFPMAKQAMDFYFTKHKKEEREFQQLFIRENNYSGIANSTDYFIIDIEYEFGPNARFDLIGVEWHSEATKRKLQKNYQPKLVIFEMKYGDDALKGSSGMAKHLNDFKNLVTNPVKVADFKNEMLELLEQKRRLNLIPCLSSSGNANAIKSFAPEIDLVFLIVNHDPASTRLQAELSTLTEPEVKFSAANFMGYGLYHQNVYKLSDFQSRFKGQIFNP